MVDVPAPSEFEIQRALIMWLDGYPDKHGNPTRTPALKPGALCWHTPNGGSRRSDHEGLRLKQMGVRAGIFDLAFLHHGLFFVLELKAEDGDLSQSQRDMWHRYEQAGAAGVAVARSLAEAKNALFHWGLAHSAT